MTTEDERAARAAWSHLFNNLYVVTSDMKCFEDGFRSGLAHARSQNASGGEARAWLIEAPGRMYLAADQKTRQFFWTTSHERALRFYSREQCDAAMMAIRELATELFTFDMLGSPSAVEHMWVDAFDQATKDSGGSPAKQTEHRKGNSDPRANLAEAGRSDVAESVNPSAVATIAESGDAGELAGLNQPAPGGLEHQLPDKALPDEALSAEQIRERYPRGSPDYPTHCRDCGCSGCYASWGEWRGKATGYQSGLAARAAGGLEQPGESAYESADDFAARFWPKQAINRQVLAANVGIRDERIRSAAEQRGYERGRFEAWRDAMAIVESYMFAGPWRSFDPEKSPTTCANTQLSSVLDELRRRIDAVQFDANRTSGYRTSAEMRDRAVSAARTALKGSE